MAEISFNSLVEILRDHDIPFDRDALKSALDDPENQTTVQAWMQEYLSPETLLTKDEAALYAAILKSGNADSVASTPDLSTVPRLSDQDIQEAIEELKRSTVAIEKQTESLKHQQNAMRMLVKDNTRLYERRSQANKSQQREWKTEKGSIITAVGELSRNLKYQTADLEQQSMASETAVRQAVEDILRSDDKLLSSLQKLASDLDPVQSEDDSTILRIKDLCARLIKYTVEGIRTKLDRIYLDALNNPVEISAGHHATSQEVAELQDELESLYAEILPVAQMSAEQQHLEPALREFSAREGHGQDRSVKAVKYMNDCLQYLVNRTEAFLEHAQEQQCQKMALKFILDEAKKELLRTEVSISDTKPKPTKPTTQRRKSSSSGSPVRRRIARRGSAGHPDDEIEPEVQLLRNLGISIPAEAAKDQLRIEALERALLDRASKLEGHANSLQSSTESTISSNLLDAHATLHLLRDSLLALSPYHSVKLFDPEAESSITALEEDVQKLEQELEKVDLQKLQVRNVHREQLVQRWLR